MKAIVIARDRVSYTRQCVEALKQSPGITDIHIVDHGSTWEPMRDYLREVAGLPSGAQVQWPEDVTGPAPQLRNARVHVHWRGNDHPRALWSNGTLAGIVDPNERFVVTDCDVLVPAGGLGAGRDWVAVLGALLDAAPWATKAGLGLDTEGIPDSNLERARIRLHERAYQSCRHVIDPDHYAHEGEPCEVWAGFNGITGHRASVDTTVAMYPRLEAFALDPAIRTTDPAYWAEHLSWLEPTTLDALTPELTYYRANMLNGVSHWADPDNYQGTFGLPETSGS